MSGAKYFWLLVVLGGTLWFWAGSPRSVPGPGEEVSERAERNSRIQLPSGLEVPRGVVIVTVDTLRADHLGCYGNPVVQTPAFDRLAAGGQLFTNAIAQSTTTTPSHASLFTSLYPQDHQVYSNFEALGEGALTLAEVLEKEGYATFGVVNMRHLNPEVGNLGQGITDFIRSSEANGAAGSVDAFLHWLDGVGERPFFAWLHFADVHTPYQPPAPYRFRYYQGDERSVEHRSLARVFPLLPKHISEHHSFLGWLKGVTDLRWVMAQYKGAVSYVDHEFGRVVNHLSRRGLLERTALVVTSDHGENLGEHEMYFVHTGLYESTVRVPLLTYFPGMGHQGGRFDDVVELIDVFPTVLDYLELPTPEGIKGRSLWPLVRGDFVEERAAMSEHAGRSLVSLRGNQFKYIKHLRDLGFQPGYPIRAGREELYDLRADRREGIDLSSLRPRVLRRFRSVLKGRRADRRKLAAGESALSEETLKVLKSLGYIQ